MNYIENSVSLHEFGSEYKTGKYYVPDYVLKYQDGNVIRYIVCDAKYSSFQTVKYEYMPRLIYKYLFSVSSIPIQEKSISIIGLMVFFGKSFDIMTNTSVYDNQLGETITPLAEMLPISEIIGVEYQSRILENMLRELCTSLLAKESL